MRQWAHDDPRSHGLAVGEVEGLAVDGLRWLAAAARETAGGGLAWTTSPSDDLNPMLYSGTAGILSVFLEAWRHFGDDSYADIALHASRSLVDSVDGIDDDSLYFGRTEMALVLRAVHDTLGDEAAGVEARRAGTRTVTLRRNALGRAGRADGRQCGDRPRRAPGRRRRTGRPRDRALSADG
ncbi:lanthionine synthetase LanC family protein [Streptomyces bauhiniae]|uniref:lanthionine synthetase LanC family protein n=1 Tax=Streptomyces bauhiniae TaxID=2340725 RepID=UPI00362DD47E